MRSQVASEILMHWVWNGNEHVIEICMVTQLHVIWQVHANKCYSLERREDTVCFHSTTKPTIFAVGARLG